ncbi:hypothetical protein [Phenylobacterium sp.]|nr:hypothetical protein [Phenylobacterium sp.]MDP3853876.1 hypothetical protein [Phenylobacterium sp.]
MARYPQSNLLALVIIGAFVGGVALAGWMLQFIILAKLDAS